MLLSYAIEIEAESADQALNILKKLDEEEIISDDNPWDWNGKSAKQVMTHNGMEFTVMYDSASWVRDDIEAEKNLYIEYRVESPIRDTERFIFDMEHTGALGELAEKITEETDLNVDADIRPIPGE